MAKPTSVYEDLVDTLKRTIKTQGKPRVADVPARRIELESLVVRKHRTVGFSTPKVPALEVWLARHAIHTNALVITRNQAVRERLMARYHLQGLEEAQVITYREAMEEVRFGSSDGFLGQRGYWLLYDVTQYRGPYRDALNSFYYHQHDWREPNNHLLLIHPE